MLDERIYESYIGILKEEMVPAMGCTEPIALAYGAARAREVLGKEPEHITAKCSGNIIKNVRCVIIPNSGVEGSKLIFKKVLPLMGVEFVRYGMLTVVPFPFKYLREYIVKEEKSV